MGKIELKEHMIGNIREENLVVETGQFYRINGIVIGDITVQNKSLVEMHGTTNGNIIIEKGGHCLIAGCVNGKVSNEGKLDHYGIINGTLNSSEDATTYVDDNAIVKLKA